MPRAATDENLNEYKSKKLTRKEQKIAQKN